MQDCLLDLSKIDSDLSPEHQIAAVSQCVDERVRKALKETEEEIKFQASVRMDMGNELSKYICRDEGNATLTSSWSNLTWEYLHPSTRESNKHDIRALFDAHESSSAMLIEEFITPQQCRALDSHAETNATYASGSMPRSVPGTAKGDMDVLEVLLKAQSYVKTAFSENLHFRREPILTQHLLRENANQDETVCEASSSNVPDESCSSSLLLQNDRHLETYMVPATASGTLVFFCSSTGGAMHFPRTGVHLPASKVVGSALFISHHKVQRKGNDSVDTKGGDAYMGEYVLCHPQKPGSVLNLFLTSFEF